MTKTTIGPATLYLGDCLETLRGMPDNSVDSICTDPPYGLSDHKPGEVVACLQAWLAGEVYAPKGKGFMGKSWDAWVHGPEVWRECLRVLKPGGHVLAFAGTRSMDLMSMALRLAGFELRDSIGYAHDGGGAPLMAWTFGSGFPKSHDVSKAIDREAGAEREKKQIAYSTNVLAQGIGVDRPWMREAEKNGYHEVDGDTPATEAARKWQGWGSALKPAWEPILLARKPLGTCATNVLQMVESQLRERGVRGEILWKPENASGAARSKKTTSSGSTRPLEASETFAKNADESVTRSVEQQSLKSSEKHGTSGINPTLGGSESFHGFTTSGCENPLSPPTAGSAPAAESVSVIFSPSTTSTAEEHSTENKFTGRSTHNCAEKDSRLDTASFAGIATGLTGSMGTVHISRDSEGFFLWPKGLPEFVPGSPLTVAANVLAWGTGALNIDGCRVGHSEACRIMAPSQANIDNPSEKHRQAGRRTMVLELKPEGRWPANLIHDGSDEVRAGFPDTAPSKAALRSDVCDMRGGNYGNSQGSRQGTESVRGHTDNGGSAARFFYSAKVSKSERNEGMPDGMVNNHPTLKPVSIMAYLCRLITPPGGVVLDPFMGSGSTGKAAMREGFDFIGCELSPEYIAIAAARIEHEWMKAQEKEAQPAQGSLM